MQIDIRTSENNAALCAARLQIADGTALPAESLTPAPTAAVNSSRGEMCRGLPEEPSPPSVLAAPSLVFIALQRRKGFAL